MSCFLIKSLTCHFSGHVVEPFDPYYPHADILSDIGRKPWSDYRQNEEKIHIPKTFSQYGKCPAFVINKIPERIIYQIFSSVLATDVFI